MNIVYTKHLLESIKLRNIEKSFVDACVFSPDKILPGNNNKKVYLKDMGINYLKVIVAQEENSLLKV